MLMSEVKLYQNSHEVWSSGMLGSKPLGSGLLQWSKAHLKNLFTLVCVCVCVCLSMCMDRTACCNWLFLSAVCVLGTTSDHWAWWQAPSPPKHLVIPYITLFKWKNTSLRLTVNTVPGLRLWYQFNCLPLSFKSIVWPPPPLSLLIWFYSNYFCCGEKSLKEKKKPHHHYPLSV